MPLEEYFNTFWAKWKKEIEIVKKKVEYMELAIGVIQKFRVNYIKGILDAVREISEKEKIEKQNEN